MNHIKHMHCFRQEKRRLAKNSPLTKGEAKQPGLDYGRFWCKNSPFAWKVGVVFPERKPNWALLAVAFEAVLAPVVATWMGLEIDRRMATKPWGLVGGLVFGAGASLVMLRVLMQQLSKVEKTKDDLDT